VGSNPQRSSLSGTGL